VPCPSWLMLCNLRKAPALRICYTLPILCSNSLAWCLPSTLEIRAGLMTCWGVCRGPKCELVAAPQIFPLKTIFCNLIEFSMRKTTQNSMSPTYHKTAPKFPYNFKFWFKWISSEKIFNNLSSQTLWNQLSAPPIHRGLSNNNKAMARDLTMTNKQHYYILFNSTL